MADRIVIEGVAPYDGSYEFDPEQDFTTTEWSWIKKLSGYLPLTVEEGFKGADPELFCVLGVIALHRAGKIDKSGVLAAGEALADAPFGTAIRFESEEVEESPPEETQEKPGGSGVQIEEPSASSGDVSRSDSEHQGNGLSPTGHPDSPRSVISSQEISAS